MRSTSITNVHNAHDTLDKLLLRVGLLRMTLTLSAKPSVLALLHFGTDYYPCRSADILSTFWRIF